MCFLTRCRISMCQGLGPEKHDEISEIDRMFFVMCLFMCLCLVCCSIIVCIIMFISTSTSTSTSRNRSSSCSSSSRSIVVFVRLPEWRGGAHPGKSAARPKESNFQPMYPGLLLFHYYYYHYYVYYHYHYYYYLVLF